MHLALRETSGKFHWVAWAVAPCSHIAFLCSAMRGHIAVQSVRFNHDAAVASEHCQIAQTLGRRVVPDLVLLCFICVASARSLGGLASCARRSSSTRFTITSWFGRFYFSRTGSVDRATLLSQMLNSGLGEPSKFYRSAGFPSDFRN